MIMKKYSFYKSSDYRWYVDLPDWTGSKAELEMVAGADTMLEYMAEAGDKVDLFISEEEFEGGDLLKLEGLADDIGSGAYYLMQTYKGIDINLTLWLCDVTLFVFNNRFPEKIYLCKIEL